MLWKVLQWAWYRYRPDEGWLPFFLLLVAIVSVAGAVVAVEWVPEVNVVAVTAVLGLVLGVVLAKRPLSTRSAWLLILAYDLLLTTLYLGKLLPPPSALLRGEGALFVRQQWALFVDRMGGWLLAVTRGGQSHETLPFAFALGLLAGLLAAYTAWSTYRQRRPLVGLTLMGLGLAVNGYFGGDEAPLWLVSFFVGFTVLLVAATHFANLERAWAQTGIDYSPEIRIELLAAAGSIALLLTVPAFFLPAIRLSTIADAFRHTEAVQQTEAMLQRAFAGVRQPRSEAQPAFAPGGAGVLPRSFLLGSPPELYETVAMTATVAPALPAGSHWRAASYDTYTGRGWTLSQEREETFPAGTRLPLPAAQEQTVFTQTVHWLYDDRAIRYTVGLPLQFGGESTVYWRGVADFSRAQGSGTSYSARSGLATAGPAALRRAKVAETPAVLLSRYTKLPGGLPQRVVQLAHDVAGSLPTPYDQARALEAFLRQYPYSLEVESPPPGRDPVEFFLFELQEGYCDYYASAMVVMARSLGLPARLATGYLAQPPDARGVQTMFQINAHAWAEVYFAGYGWVEFEPTAAFPTAAGADAAVTESDPGLSATEPAVEPPPIPEGAPSRLSSLWAVLLMLLIAGLWLWWHRRPAAARGVAWAYERLLRAARALGQPTPPSETPLEFAAAFVARLAGWEQHSRLGRLLHDVRPGVERLTILFVAQQYGGAPAGWSARSEARRIWRHLAGRLRVLRLWLFLKKGLK